ncbi:GNAT family N-acetyltransferase [Lysinibacillus sp. NPDC097287]|uniref:GNAT family N-acetyltransferase n=1 Tax=Lysinibacillus sp. NPDC097287 TaxID=3364144 RepID=UPI0038112B8F
MKIICIEGVPYEWLKSLQGIHAQVFDGSSLPVEKLESKNELLCLLAVEGQEVVGFKLGYRHPDGVFYSWLGGVLESKRGQGIASQLMKYQHEQLRVLGYKKVRTYGRNTKKAMLIVNIKHGFSIVSTFTDEKGRHKIIFEKSLV